MGGGGRGVVLGFFLLETVFGSGEFCLLLG